MNCYLISGSLTERLNFIEKFILDNSYLPYEVERYEGKIKIEESRGIKSSLSYKTQGKKLIVLNGEITIEAQNALLKSIEELNENIQFIIAIENEAEILPTIQSRCLLFKLDITSFDLVKELVDFSEEIVESQNKWKLIDEISRLEMLKNNPAILQVALREKMLQALDFSECQNYYSYLKKLLALLPLAENNNVNMRNILERVFL